MTLYNNSHAPTPALRQRVADLAVAGIPVYLIAKIIKIDDETLTKYYEYELSCAEAEAIERVAKVVSIQAEGGNEKSQALLLKTRGAKYGWVEKQVIETKNADEVKDLKDTVKALEEKYSRDY